MNSQGCSGSIAEATLSFSFQVIIGSDGTGSACLLNTNPNNTSWNSFRVTAPIGSFPANGGDGGFQCPALALDAPASPFANCTPPGPNTPALGPAFWLFSGGDGVPSAHPCGDFEYGNTDCNYYDHVQFNFIGFDPGTYNMEAAANGVPEPATAALLATGLAGLFSRRKRLLQR